MEFLPSLLLANLPYITSPDIWGGLVWVLLLALTVYLLIRWRQYQPVWNVREWGLLVGLAIFAVVSALFIGIRFSSQSSLSVPDIPVEPQGSALMPFSAIPWTIAGGVLGPVGAALVGCFSGLVRGIWDTHSLFTALELALLGVLFSLAVRQRYRTAVFGLLRQPLIAALCLLPLHMIIYVVGTYFTVPGSVTARLDYAISNVLVSTLAVGGELLLAGLVGQVFAMAAPSAWGRSQPLQPSPTERSLEVRFLLGTGTFITLLLLTLLIGDWIVAGQAARSMLRDRLNSTASVASQSVPFFLETGQNLAVQLAADPRLLTSTDPELSSVLGQRIQAVPYFEQFFVLDVNTKTLLGVYPQSARDNFSLAKEEENGVDLAASGVLAQIYTIDPEQPGGIARVSFLAAIVDPTGAVHRVLVGRTDLGTNPLTQPLIDSLKDLSELQGEGYLIDENGRYLYHPTAAMIMQKYPGKLGNEQAFYDETAPNGTRNLVFYQPVLGRPWSIVLTVPAQQAQQFALRIALPLSIMIFVLALLALISLRFGLQMVTGSLQNLATEATRIAQGQLDHPLQVGGVDEVGQLRRSFEQMRVSLKDRLEELNQLLVVNQGVASSLQMQDAVKPVLEAVQATGASAVRVVLSPTALPETPDETPSRFAMGSAGGKYAHLDDQILELTEHHERLVMPSLARASDLELDSSLAQPASLLAVALKHENRYYGVLWAAYDRPRMFSDADIRFVTTLAGQAALAAANAYLFLSVEVGRKQLEAILDSTPDPVLVTDPQNKLLLANPAASQLLGKRGDSVEGQAVEKVVSQKELADLLMVSSAERQSAEIVLPDGRTYLATASTVLTDGRPVGRVCILRDVTYLKELDSMKSEFVATVSHDLRSPLTLMRGYATMLEMVGELNEQQQGYVRKIISGVENMSRLVNNLLDLGRIEVGVGLQLETVPTLDIVERVTSALQLQANQKNIVVNVENAPDLSPLIEADQALLHQAVYNLVENAIKYTRENGRVNIRLYNKHDSIIFEIQDTGIGITPSDLPNLFQKFYRGKQREARAQSGTGLGLAIVRSIAERHNGRVWVESTLGKGSTFFLQIPLSQKKE
jgi:PAS domain S-box-containing protein